jgi:hypothetical protein
VRRPDGNCLNGGLPLQLNLREHDLGCRFVKHVALDPGLAEVGFSGPELGLGALAIGRHAAGRKTPPGTRTLAAPT